eukprot:Skav224081  [mRNA]  locus=scaffold942:175798:183971:- [translate_table: standard]
MFVHLTEVLQSLLSGGSAQALVVLCSIAPGPLSACGLLPGFKVALGEEFHTVRRRLLVGTRWKDLDQRRGKPLQKVRLHLQKAGPKRGEEVDDKTCDVMTVQILITKEHHLLISQIRDLLEALKLLAPT